VPLAARIGREKPELITALPDSVVALVLVFAAAAAAVWVAGIWLSRMTDVLSVRFHLGEAPAGSVLCRDGDGHPALGRKTERSRGISTGRAVAAFLVAAAVTLAAGVVLERDKRPAAHAGTLSAAPVLPGATSADIFLTALGAFAHGRLRRARVREAVAASRLRAG
jgi:hypothetical protein